ncbi:MAG: dihydrofolate reductase [Saprospiraceae bacterium]|nr:dihydrofolate reductase [Saprospiraceae bacterium]
MKISLIVAHDNNRAIGKDGDLPWHLPNDLKWFKKHTVQKMVVMGRKTYIGLKFQPLPKRINVVMTKNESAHFQGAVIAKNLLEVLQIASAKGIEELMITGGGQIYSLFLPLADRLYITKVNTEIDGADAYFPEFKEKEWNEVFSDAHAKDDKHAFDFTFHIYERPIR